MINTIEIIFLYILKQLSQFKNLSYSIKFHDVIFICIIFYHTFSSESSLSLKIS